MRRPIVFRRMWSLTTMVVPSLTLAIHVQGCTVIGLTLGSMADRQRNVGGADLLLEVHPGQRMWLTLWDGRTLEGRFAGWSHDSTAKPDSNGVYPARGAVVRFATRDGEVVIPTEAIARVTMNYMGDAIALGLLGFIADYAVVSTARYDPSGGCEVPNLSSSQSSLDSHVPIRRSPHP